MKKARPDWNSYFMEIAGIVARSPRACGGAWVLSSSRRKRILSTGYNGPPMGLAHCEDVGCVREQQNVVSGERHELCRGLHAEQNGIIQAAYHGVPIKGADIYSTHLPCSICVKMIINAGLQRIFYLEGYPDDLASRLVKESGIIIEQLTVTG